MGVQRGTPLVIDLLAINKMPMEILGSFAMLAASLDAGRYADPIKIGVIVVLFLGWAAAAQWVDRDTTVVKTKREQWNGIILSGGGVAAFVLFIPPIWHGQLFIAGVAIWLLLSGGPLVAYVMHRNGRVLPGARILTVGHAKRLVGGGEKRKKVKDKGQSVRIEDHKGAFVELPDDPEEAEAFQAVQDFLFDMLWRRASDIDLVAGKEKYRFVYRIDGVATENPDGLSPEKGERIFRFLKKIAGLNTEEIRRPQTGSITAALLSQEGSAGKTEVFTSGTTAGERMRLRIGSGPTLMRLHELGMASARLEVMKKCLAKHHGLVLITGPAKNGMTTTQYAILKGHDAYMNNIHALERRPLTELDNITQRKYEGGNTDVNYARMLQTVLRKEPDIIMVGECEDRETALIATRAGAEKKKIYLGFKASDTFDALAQYIKFVNDTKLVAKILVAVLNQRLVRILCTECKEAFEPDPATLKKLNLPADKIEHFYRPPTIEEGAKRKPKTCPHCQGSGYFGRTGIFELLVVDAAVAKLIAEGAPISRIKSQCRKNKMYYLQEEGLLKVIDGTTSMNEILRSLRTDGK